MRGELVIPLQLPGVRIEGQHRAGVEVVSRPGIAVVVRPRIAGAPEDGVRLRVVGPVVPGSHAAGFPRVPVPRSEIRLARLRYGVEPPDALAGGCVVGIDEAGD